MAAGDLADRPGYDTAGTWDHLVPLHQGRPGRSILEPLMTLAGWAAVDASGPRSGLMVAANTFRNPACW